MTYLLCRGEQQAGHADELQGGVVVKDGVRREAGAGSGRHRVLGLTQGRQRLHMSNRGFVKKAYT